MKEENILESFKQYHNANWHDGDNTFDERTYAKSNKEDFDDQFVQDCFDHYEAGYRSCFSEVIILRQEMETLEKAYEEVVDELVYYRSRYGNNKT